MAKRLSENEVLGLIGDSSSNYINEVSDGVTTYSVAVKKGITFFNGQDTSDGVTWDGSQELEVVIPTISDLIIDPVRLVGVISSDNQEPTSAQNGDLVYIQNTCTFASEACEAGDMAVYYNDSWHVISGENQVSLGNTFISLGKTAQSIITVEGQDLSLAIDYDDVRSNISYTTTTNSSTSLGVSGGDVIVTGKSIALSYAGDSTVNIAESVSVSLPYELASSNVTIDSVLQSSDFDFSAGSFPTVNTNSSLSFDADYDLSVTASGDGSFVTDVTAIKSVTFTSGSDGDNDIAFGAALSSVSGTEFLTGVHVYDSTIDDSQSAAFTIWGEATVSNSTFVSGLGEASVAGSDTVVSDVTVGEVGLDASGSDILTGLTTGNDMVTSVSFGSLVEDSDNEWFVNGLDTSGSDVVTEVSVGEVTFVSGNDVSGQTGLAIVSASVSNHVLSFTTESFMKPVSISQAASIVTKQGFTKGAVKLDGYGVETSGFTTASLSQPTVNVSYKSVLMGDVTLNQSYSDWYYDKAEDHNFELSMDYLKLSTESADMIKNGVVISGTITTTVSAGTFATSLSNDGVLPSLSIGDPTGVISGTLDDVSLSTSKVSWLAVNPSVSDVTLAGEYTLVEDSTVNGAIEVAVAGSYTIDAGTASVVIPSGEFMTGVDVFVDGTSVNSTVIK